MSLTNFHLLFAFCLLPFAFLAALPLAPDDPHMARRLENEARLVEWTAAQPQAETTKTWPGVHADKTARTVTVLAESTGLNANTIIEFPLASIVSNHDYEALALMLGKPTHLAEAVEWLGVPRGVPPSRRAARFWAKGERMSVTIARFATPNDAKPLGEWLVNAEDKSPAFTGHFVYTGSVWENDACAADGEVPGSVISTFNETRSLFDVPVRADKGAVYGHFVNTDKLEKGELLVFTFKPEFKPKFTRVETMPILAKPIHETITPKKLAQLCFDAKSDDENFQFKFNGTAIEVLIKCFEDLTKFKDLFIQWTLDDRITVQAAAELASIITMIEGNNGIRVDEPPAGQLYYRAFLPNPEWIPREERLTQPYELHLVRNDDGTWKRTFTSIEEDWTAPDKITPDLTVTHHPLGDDWETALLKIIAETDKENYRSALFVFTPPDTPLGAFMPVVRLLQKRLPEAHVFGQTFP